MGDCSHNANFPILRVFWEQNSRLWKTWFCGFHWLNVHLPFSNSMSLIFNVFTVCSLCPDNKHNKITSFSDRSFKSKSYFKLLKQSRTISESHTANCQGRAGLKLNIPFTKRWTRGCFLKDISLSVMRTDGRADVDGGFY